MRSHNGERPYKCSSCDYTTPRSDHLILHIRTHTGEKPYICNYFGCNVAFAISRNLNAHKKYFHSPEGIRRHKRQEQWIATVLERAGLIFKREHQIDFRCINDVEGYFARIDFVLDNRKKGIIFLEVDEHQHRFGNYSVLCDLNRMSKIVESLITDGNTLPLLFLRINSDGYKVDGQTKRCTKKTREEVLINFLNNWTFKENSPALQLQYMYYDVKDEKLAIHEDPDYYEAVKELCLKPIF